MTYLLNIKNLSKKYNALLLSWEALAQPTKMPPEKHISQWDPSFQIPAYIRKNHKKAHQI